jgi:hypothetical protein
VSRAATTWRSSLQKDNRQPTAKPGSISRLPSEQFSCFNLKTLGIGCIVGFGLIFLSGHDK